MNSQTNPATAEAPAIEDLTREAEELTTEQAEAVNGGLGTGKVSLQDFHFTVSSLGSGAGSGKVSMQDFH